MLRLFGREIINIAFSLSLCSRDQNNGFHYCFYLFIFSIFWLFAGYRVFSDPALVYLVSASSRIGKSIIKKVLFESSQMTSMLIVIKVLPGCVSKPAHVTLRRMRHSWSYPLSSAEAPLRKVSAGVKFRGRRRWEPLPETTPNMAAIRESHFVTRVVCVLMSWKWRVFVKFLIVMLRDVGDLLTKTYLHA